MLVPSVKTVAGTSGGQADHECLWWESQDSLDSCKSEIIWLGNSWGQHVAFFGSALWREEEEDCQHSSHDKPTLMCVCVWWHLFILSLQLEKGEWRCHVICSS